MAAGGLVILGLSELLWGEDRLYGIVLSVDEGYLVGSVE